MIKKLFGENEEEQLRYLKPRMIIMGVGLVLMLIYYILSKLGVTALQFIGSIGVFVTVIMLLDFGWAGVKSLLHVATIGALFSNNIVIGLVIFILFIILGYFLGFFVALVGFCRLLVILKNRK